MTTVCGNEAAHAVLLSCAVSAIYSWQELSSGPSAAIVLGDQEENDRNFSDWMPEPVGVRPGESAITHKCYVHVHTVRTHAGVCVGVGTSWLVEACEIHSPRMPA